MCLVFFYSPFFLLSDVKFTDKSRGLCFKRDFNKTACYVYFKVFFFTELATPSSDCQFMLQIFSDCRSKIT